MRNIDLIRDKLVEGIYRLENKKFTEKQVYFYTTLAASFFYNDVLNIVLSKLNETSKEETLATNFAKLLTKDTTNKIIGFYKTNKRKPEQDNEQFKYEKETAKHLNKYLWLFK